MISVTVLVILIAFFGRLVQAMSLTDKCPWH